MLTTAELLVRRVLSEEDCIATQSNSLWLSTTAGQLVFFFLLIFLFLPWHREGHEKANMKEWLVLHPPTSSIERNIYEPPTSIFHGFFRQQI